MSSPENNSDSSNPFQSPELTEGGYVVDSSKKRGPRSGVVLGVAIFNFVVGGLGLTCTGLSAIWIIFLAIPQLSPTVGPNQPAFDTKAMIAIASIGLLMYLIPSLSLLLAGYGVVKRYQWGRILCFVNAVISTLIFLLYFGLACFTLLQQGDSFGTLFLLFFSFVFLIYPIVMFSILTQSRYAREFHRV